MLPRSAGSAASAAAASTLGLQEADGAAAAGEVVGGAVVGAGDRRLSALASAWASLVPPLGVQGGVGAVPAGDMPVQAGVMRGEDARSCNRFGPVGVGA